MSRAASLALHVDDLVIVHGLSGAPQYNFQPAAVLEEPAAGARVAVRLLHGSRRQLSVKRSNLLKADRDEDRAMLLTRIVWERQLELRVARSFLLEKLRGEEGLCLEIASHFPQRETLGLTTGYAMGRIIPEWSAVTLERGRLEWRPIHASPSQPGIRQRVHGAEQLSDRIERIDCAVVAVGSGRFVVAGGCDDHPSRASGFLSSAFMYDALTHAVTPLPSMPCARHGCGGAHIDGVVYVLGGEYVARAPDAAHCVRLDLRRPPGSRAWEPLEKQLPPRALQPHGHVAFVPTGGVWGRLVVMSNGILWAYNTRAAGEAARWTSVVVKGQMRRSPMDHSTCPPGLGTSAQGCVEWGDALIVSSGRGAPQQACQVYAFSFLFPPETRGDWQHVEPGMKACIETPFWGVGEWANLGTVCASGRVGADLSVVQGRLLISGGVHEGEGGSFNGSVARWGGCYSQLPQPLSRRPPPNVDIEDRSISDETWEAEAGKLSDRLWQHLSLEGQPGVPKPPRDCQRPWCVVEDLQLPTAMHAHSAITIPLLPAASAAPAAAAPPVS